MLYTKVVPLSDWFSYNYGVSLVIFYTNMHKIQQKYE